MGPPSTAPICAYVVSGGGSDENGFREIVASVFPKANAVPLSSFVPDFSVTNVTLKSGTNELKGTAFAFGNTEATISRNPFSSLPPPDTTYAQIGAVLGGPIKRNKLFFFGDYVRTHDDSGRLTQAHLPEAAFRTGDFRAAPTTIYDPATGNPDGTGRDAFPNNQIPADRLSPIARRILANIPMPNLAGAAIGATNYEKQYVREKRTNQFDI